MNNNNLNGGRFMRGVSGNPGGRPKGRGFSAAIRKATDDGQELIQVALGIMRDPLASRSERMKALEWLGDRMLGRAVQYLDVDSTGTELDQNHQVLDFDRLTVDELLTLRALTQKAMLFCGADEPVSGNLESIGEPRQLTSNIVAASTGDEATGVHHG